MYRRPSKKQQLIRRSLVLVVMVVSVLVIVASVTLFILGYRLDSINGQLQQGALVQFNSQPTGGRISVDGTPINDRTPAKRSLLSGAHSFTVERDGYRPWTKSLNLAAGTLAWLDYIRLIPIDLQREVIEIYPVATDMKAAPNLRTLLVQTDKADPIFQLVDISAPTVSSRTLVLPENLYTADSDSSSQLFTLGAWDAGSRYVLVQHQTSGASEWIVMDTEDISESVNITQLLSIELSELQFSGTSGNILYGLTDGALRKLDISNETISRALVQGVESFNMYQTSTLTYIGVDPEDKAQRVAGLYKDGDAQPYVLAEAPLNTSLQIATTRHYNDDYVAVAEGADVTILKGRYPSSVNDTTSLQVFAEFTAPRSVDRISFSPEGDFLLAEAGKAFMSFEVEYERLTSSVVNTSQETVQPLRWLDQAYVWSVYEGRLSIREFDGTNGNVIMPALRGFDATLSQNGRYLYAMTQNSSDEYQLERTTLILQ